MSPLPLALFSPSCPSGSSSRMYLEKPYLESGDKEGSRKGENFIIALCLSLSQTPLSITSVIAPCPLLDRNGNDLIQDKPLLRPGPGFPIAMEFRLTSILKMHLSYNGQRCNIRFPKNHAERMLNSSLRHSVDTDRIERKAALH